METVPAHPVELTSEPDVIVDSNAPRMTPRIECLRKARSDTTRSSRLRQDITADENGDDLQEEAKDILPNDPLFEPERKEEDLLHVLERQKSPPSLARECSFSDVDEASTPDIKRKIGTFIKKHFPKLNHEERSHQITAGKKEIAKQEIQGLESNPSLRDSDERPLDLERLQVCESPVTHSKELEMDLSHDLDLNVQEKDSDKSNEKILHDEFDIKSDDEKEDTEWHFPKFHIKRSHKHNPENVDHLTHSRQASSKRPSRSNSFTAKLFEKLDLSRNNSDASLSEKYGKRESVVGKGAHATVRLAHKREKDAKWFAIKEFRRKKKDESEKEYIKKLIAEFCISSSLQHSNIVESIDLIKDEHDRWCEVMEYCAGGDLLSKMVGIGFQGQDEVGCLFKQLLRGISYMHNNGVVHRDLKPENLLLDATHRFLKISDFGVAVVFRTQFEKVPRKVHGLCGSAPYIAPEEWIENSEYLPTKVDIWACGMIFYSMLSKNLLWGCSQDSDPKYAQYLKKRETGYPPFEMQDPPQKELLYKMLDIDASKRPEADEMLSGPWLSNFKECEPPSDISQQPTYIHEHNCP